VKYCVRSAILATAWLLVLNNTNEWITTVISLAFLIGVQRVNRMDLWGW